MNVKKNLKNIEKKIFSFFVFRWLVLGVARIGFRVMWLFGRLRFRAHFPDAGDAVCHWSVEIKYADRILISDGVVIGPNVTLGGHGGLELCENVRISKSVFIETAGLKFDGRPPYTHKSSRTVLEEGVWVGAGAMILGGVTVGRNAVVGAGAVVSKDVAPYAVVIGNPMAVAKYYDQPAIEVNNAEK